MMNMLWFGCMCVIIDGCSVIVVGDGMLMVGKCVLIYEGVLICVLSCVNVLNIGVCGKIGIIVFVDYEGCIMIVECVDGLWCIFECMCFNCYGIDGCIMVGWDGSLMLFDGIELCVLS